MTISLSLTSFLNPLERAGRTFLQQFAVVILATGTAGLMVHQNWLLAVDSAGFAAIMSLLTSVLLVKVANTLLVRIVKTGLQSFVGTLAAANVLSVSHADWKGALAVAVATALAALASSGIPLKFSGTADPFVTGNELAAAFVDNGSSSAPDYQPGPITDPSVELDEAGNPVVDSAVDVLKVDTQGTAV